MDRCFEKAGFNPNVKFGLLRNSVMQVLDLAQFAIYRGATTYDDLKTTIKDFVSGGMVFYSSGGGMPEQTPPDDGTPKMILKRPDALERKGDVLTDQLEQLSLIVKKNQPAGGASSSPGRV